MNDWPVRQVAERVDTSVNIATVKALRECIRCLEGGARHGRAVLPFGINAIDERLPESGLALGALHEVAGGGNGEASRTNSTPAATGLFLGSLGL
jgi:protein ImuA